MPDVTIFVTQGVYHGSCCTQNNLGVLFNSCSNDV